MTDFEKHLAATPLREIPPAWRARLLPSPPPRRDWRAALSALLWPHPMAWGAVASCWLVIAALNLSGPRGAELYAVSPPGVKPVEVSTERYAAYLRMRDVVLADRGDVWSPMVLDRHKL